MRSSKKPDEAKKHDDLTKVDSAPPLGTGAAVELGTVVDGRYRVDSELGRGGMGVVYLATDQNLDRKVALKMIAPTWAKDGQIAASFVREAKALASIRSPYVVQVYAFGGHEGARFFVMEYVRGRSVREILKEHHKHGDTIPTHRALTILNRIAQGIDAVHNAGILHRDVKPANIVIEEETGRPVLVDFGLAVPGDDPAAALALGTPHYMAPEQGGVGVPGSTVTARIDVYALGVTAFELLTGELPFDTSDHARLMRMHARKTPPVVSSKRADLAAFDKTIARALAKDPNDRYPSCTAFAEVLAAASERWVDSNLPTLPPPPASQKAGSPSSAPGPKSAKTRAEKIGPPPPSSKQKPTVALRGPSPALPAPLADSPVPSKPVAASMPVAPSVPVIATGPVGPNTPARPSMPVSPSEPAATNTPARLDTPSGRTPSLTPSSGIPLGGAVSSGRSITPQSVSRVTFTPAGTPSHVRVFQVLVVDDSPLFRKSTVQATQIAFFRRKNHAVSVRGAGSGREALELAAAHPPDMVLLDYDMPGLDGVNTLSRLRELPGGHNARVVVLSGRVSAADKWRFSVLGVNDFVQKPIEMRQLVERIEAIAKRFEESQRARPAPTAHHG